MEAIGAVAIFIIRGICWIGLGILTFNWIGVDDFGSAIWWLIAWHVATYLASWVFIFIVGAIVTMFDN